MSNHAPFLRMLETCELVDFTGKVTSIGQGSVTAKGPLCSVGEFCTIGDDNSCLAEVVAVESGTVTLLPLNSTSGLLPGAKVARSDAHSTMSSGDAFAGRAVDAFGAAIDGLSPVLGQPHASGASAAMLDKTIATDRVMTGLRAIDTLLPLAKGQRTGIFAAAGVGKTTLVEQLSTHVECDHVVACLIGERGREVDRFWALHKDSAAAGRTTLVAATSDESASARVRAMHQALALCEAWRAKGKHVVLFVDSITRLAMALREIGLASGEPPALRSYTPNVFATIPHIVERCGAIKGGGAITAVFTVLSETDDVDDPIVETMKSILDGHIVLSRKLAEKGHFPAIDIPASISRVADQVLSAESVSAARALRKAFADYQDSRAMIESGLYRPGSDDAIDAAIAMRPRITEFLQQTAPERHDAAKLDKALIDCMSGAAVV